MNLCKKFHFLNRTMGKCSKIGGIVLGKGENLGDGGNLKKSGNVINGIPK